MEFSATKNFNKHRPFHIYSGHTYFVTARMYEGNHLMADELRRSFFQKKVGELTKEMDIGLFAWVILKNHYHMMFTLQREGVTNASSSNDRDKLAFVTPNDGRGEKLVKFVRRLHAISTKEFNLRDNTPGRQVWHQYWDYCIRNEADFWKHFNYIVQNPLKHKLVKTLAEAYEYPYSSNPVWLKRFGKDGLSESFTKYPVKDWTPNEGLDESI